jgi:hypothetical protein
MVLEALSFLCFALVHLGVRVPVDLVVIQEPRRPFAVIVEGLAAVALAGVLWGMVAIAAGRGPHTQLNDTYHRVMVVVLGAGLILLLTRPGRTALDSHPVSRAVQD